MLRTDPQTFGREAGDSDACAVSVVVPLNNERLTLAPLTQRVAEQLRRETRSFELILVDDGSTDGSWEEALELAADLPELRVLRHRRSFGKAAALGTGFRAARGDVVITMDADLQDDPAEIPRFLARLAEGADVVSGWKRIRHDPRSKTLPSTFFNRVVRGCFGLELHDCNCGFKAYTRAAATSLTPHLYGDMHRFLPPLLDAKGFSVAEIEVTHHPREAGSSHYGARRMFGSAFDLLTVVMLTQYQAKPMHAFAKLALAAFLVGCFGAVAAVATGHPIQAIAVASGAGMGSLLFLGVGLVCELVIHSTGRGSDPSLAYMASARHPRATLSHDSPFAGAVLTEFRSGARRTEANTLAH